MVTLVVDIAVMPQQTQISVMHPHFANQPFAEEISLVFGQIHIVLVTQSPIHDHERMEREVGHLIGLRIDPSYVTGSLQTETGRIGKAHSEIIRIACGCQMFEMRNRPA